MVREVSFDGGGLVGWHGEDVAEATAGVDDCLAGFFRSGDAGARDDLCRTDGGYVGAV